MNAGSLQALCQLGKLASRPRNSIAIVGCRASHCGIANARASATCQSVGIGCIITEALPGNHRTERTGGVAISLYANNKYYYTRKQRFRQEFGCFRDYSTALRKKGAAEATPQLINTMRNHK